MWREALTQINARCRELKLDQNLGGSRPKTCSCRTVTTTVERDDSRRVIRREARKTVELARKRQEAQMLGCKGWLSSAGRSVALAMIAVLVVTTSESPPAIAGPAAHASKGVPATASSNATDVSARRRYHRGGGNAAALAIMGMALGTIGAIAAQQNYGYGCGPYACGGPYYYGGGPYYYGGGPFYYGGGPYYGRRYYRYRYW
jgi:hypothetical protein